MTMQAHILAALREQFDRWEALLGSLTEAQLSAPHPATHWSIKDEIAHLRAWRLRTLARLEAALADREPIFPQWLPVADTDAAATTDQTNAWLYETNRNLPWPTIHQAWQQDFHRLLDLAAQFSEKDLFDESRYPWLNDVPLGLILISTYDHHQEHLDKLLERLAQDSPAHNSR